LIVNRAGTDTLSGGKGDDLFVFKESAGTSPSAIASTILARQTCFWGLLRS
jgi:hypothetical protein